MKVRITAGGREVEVECPDVNVSPADVLAEALKTWQATEGAKEPSEGPAYGFKEDRRGWQVEPMTMGGYGGEYMTEPKAAAGRVGGA